MVSNVSMHAARDLARELARAYDGEVPPPYYWQVPAAPRHTSGRGRPGELRVALPYSAMPMEFLLERAVSLDQLEDLLERRARHEELTGSS